MEMPLDIRSRTNCQLTEVITDKFPPCDICLEPAHYDAKSQAGPWGYFCERHFKMYCSGRLGTGIGQRIILRVNQGKSNG